MLKIFNSLLIIILLPIELFSQMRVIDEKDSTAIPYAHIFIDDMLYTYSDESAEFTIDKKLKFDTLTVAHLSYETKRLSYNDLKATENILMKEKYNKLEEVSININRKSKKRKVILPEKATRDLFGKDYDLPFVEEMSNNLGEEYDLGKLFISRAIYVPNANQRENALVTKIILNSIDEIIEGDSSYMPFKVNLMTYDTITKLPKNKIFNEDLSVGKKRGQKVVIDLTKENPVEFPKEGIFIIVSVYSTNYYMINGFMRPPKFDAVALNKASAFREYLSYDLHKWQELKYSQRREQCFNFGVEIQYFK